MEAFAYITLQEHFPTSDSPTAIVDRLLSSWHDLQRRKAASVYIF